MAVMIMMRAKLLGTSQDRSEQDRRELPRLQQGFEQLVSVLCPVTLQTQLSGVYEEVPVILNSSSSHVSIFVVGTVLILFQAVRLNELVYG
jgi:hypothetical protein